jgi:hypothetical protein
MNKPLTNFTKTIERALQLLDYYDPEAELDEPEDILRAAIIIAIAGMDRYFTSKFCDILVPYLKEKKPGKDLLLRLAEAGLNAEFALDLIVSERPYRKLRTIVQKSLSHETTHRMEVIDALFKDIALKDLTKNAQKKCGKSRLLRSVEILVDHRNSISHEAHLNSHGNTRRISEDETRRRIEDVRVFINACEEIIESKIGKTKPIT